MASASSELDFSFLKSEVVCPQVLEPWFSHLQSGNNNIAYVMVPGLSHLTADGSVVVKATVMMTKNVAIRAERLSFILRQIMSITAQGQPGQLLDSWLTDMKFWPCTPQG